MQMEKNARQRARQRLVAAMLAGQSWQEIARAEALPLKRAMAYRLVQAVRTRGDVALADGRHGHPSKLRGEARAFLEEQCRQAPATPSSTLQVELRERFEPPREHQPDQPRASSSRSEQPSHGPETGKKTEGEEVSPQAQWQEGAGGLLLLAAAHQTNLLTHLEAALTPNLFAAPPSLRLARLQRGSPYAVSW
jgi:transposase